MLLPLTSQKSGSFAAAACKQLRKASTKEREYQTYEGWKRACKTKYPDCTFRGDRYIGAASVNGKEFAEWDGAVGVIFAKKVGQAGVGMNPGSAELQQDTQLIKNSYQSMPNVAIISGGPAKKKLKPLPDNTGKKVDQSLIPKPLTPKKAGVENEAEKLYNATNALHKGDVAFEQFRKGLQVEMEHAEGPLDVVHGDLEVLAKIVLAHLVEDPHYYSKLAKVKL